MHPWHLLSVCSLHDSVLAMKEWPEDNKPADFEVLCGHVRKAILYAYDMQRKNRGKAIPWDGPPTMQEAGPDFLLSADRLKYAEEDQGRDALDTLIGIAVQLGIEQGRRVAADRPDMRLLETLKRLEKKLERRSDEG